jgi:hypothetical protein
MQCLSHKELNIGETKSRNCFAIAARIYVEKGRLIFGSLGINTVAYIPGDRQRPRNKYTIAVTE